MLTQQFREVVEDRPLRSRKGRLRFFESSVLEALTRSPVWLPFVIYGPAVVWGVWRLGEPRWAPLLCGFGFWFVLEYFLHRFFFHLPVRGETAAGFRFFVHEHHHAFPNDYGRLVATPWQSGLAMALLAAIESATWGHWQWALVGSVTGYLIYESVHIAIHMTETKWIHWLRAHHLRHHAEHGAGRAFGISSPLLDIVFRTRR